MSAAHKVRAGRRIVEVGRPEKVLFADDGVTKADLAAYYRTVAPRMLPHLRGRPLMLERHPDGIDDPDLHARRWTLVDADGLRKDNPWGPAPRPHSLSAAADRLRHGGA